LTAAPAETAAGTPAMPAAAGVSVIIVSYNGRRLLAESLPPTLAALAAAAVRTEVIVVDNGSTDGTVAWLRAAFPAVIVIAVAGNAHFGEGNAIGVRAARYAHVLLLNNDMAIDPGYVDLLLAQFTDPAVFAVDGTSVDWNRIGVIEAGKSVRFARGWFAISEAPPRPAAGPTFYATGGGMLVDREKFRALGGFDPLFHPFYVEDVDLSYRAWRSGWTVRHEPRAVLRHRLRASTTSYCSERRRRRILLRNYWLFYWKNVSDRELLTAHLLHLPAILLDQIYAEGLNALAAFAAALTRLPAALAARRTLPCRRGDGEIMALLS